ncbi:MAG: hypothetical protein QW238_00035 [Candidatus Bathyarchaeia archaeon]
MGASPDETVGRIGEFAKKVGKLRETSDAIIFHVGHEFGLEAAILPGKTWWDRPDLNPFGFRSLTLRALLSAIFIPIPQM